MTYFKKSAYSIFFLLFLYTVTFNVAYNAEISQGAVFLANLELSNATAAVEQSLKLVENAASAYNQAVQSGGDQQTLSRLYQTLVEAKETLRHDSLRIWHHQFKSQIIGISRWYIFEKVDIYGVCNSSLVYSDLSSLSNSTICERLTYLTEFLKNSDLCAQSAQNVFQKVQIVGHTNEEIHEVYYKTSLYQKELASIINHLKTNPELFQYCLDNYNL